MFFENFFRKGRDEQDDDRLLRSHPRDSSGRVVFLDDCVVHKGRLKTVVAMSHKGKVVVRDPDSKGAGGRWVPASEVTVRSGSAA